MKKKILIVAGAILALALLSVIFRKISKKESVFTYETVKVEKGSISNAVTATGTINAITSVNVGTQVSGIIQKLFVDFNDQVKKGQLLAKIDETNLREQLRQSEAGLDQARAQLTFNEATYKRVKALYEKNLIAEADYDQALYNYENSKASLINATSAVSRAHVNLDYATITSPIDGIVLNRAVEEGQTVAASFTTPTLFTIVNDLTQMEVQTSVDEADIGKVKEGQRVEFTVDTYIDQKFEATVSQLRLQPINTNNVVTYTVILSARNPEKKLMPGMTASASIFVEEKESTLILNGKAVRFSPSAEILKKMSSGIPGSKDSASARTTLGMVPGKLPSDKSSILQGIPGTGSNTNIKLPPNSKMVWIREGNNGARPLIINTGIDNGVIIEVVSGLKEGDEVITSIKDGSKNSASNASRPQGLPF
jgi:HlyD family secretion protein